MISLRDYQLSGVNRLRESIQKHRASVLVAPTGAGKTRMAIRIMQGAVAQGNRCWFLVHRRELCMQTSRALWDAKLAHGMIMPGKGRSPTLAQVGTVLTAANRIKSMRPEDRPKVIVFDECHRSVSSGYRRILDACPDAYIIGLTATPQRTDGRGLIEVYNDLVEVQNMEWLIKNGYLSPYRLIAPVDGPDLSRVGTVAGDYDQKALAETMDRPTVTGDAIAAYKKYAMGKRCMVFCVSIAHSEHTCAQYNAAGIKAEHLDGTNTDAEREAVLSRFRAGETLVLCSVNLATEGIDIPAVEAVQQLRPTQSIIVYLQIVGRGLRVEEGKKELIILDQSSNYLRHGLPDDPREWTLEGRKKGKRKNRDEDPDINVQQCRNCFHVFRKGPSECPQCKHAIEVTGREVKQVDGELAEVDLAAARRERAREQGKARGLYDLVRVGVQRGMKNPAAWAAIVYGQRQGRKPTPAEFNEAKGHYREITQPVQMGGCPI